MTERAARTPFHFFGCWELREMLGRRAYDERELLEHLEDVPLDSIYFHTHSCLLHEVRSAISTSWAAGWRARNAAGPASATAGSSRSATTAAASASAPARWWWP